MTQSWNCIPFFCQTIWFRRTAPCDATFDSIFSLKEITLLKDKEVVGLCTSFLMGSPFCCVTIATDIINTKSTFLQITQCKDCPGGYYCPNTAATNYTQLCQEGYWCQSGLDRGNPNAPGSNDTYNETCPLLGGYTGVGGVCPRGHRCPKGTTLPLGCDAGYYQDQEGEGDCKSCPAG